MLVPVSICCAEVDQQPAELNTLLSVKAKLVYSAVCWSGLFLFFLQRVFWQACLFFFLFFFDRNVLPIQQSHLKISFRWYVLFLPCDVWNWGGLLKYSVWREITQQSEASTQKDRFVGQRIRAVQSPTCGLPSSILDLTSGEVWQILTPSLAQQFAVSGYSGKSSS